MRLLSVTPAVTTSSNPSEYDVYCSAAAADAESARAIVGTLTNKGVGAVWREGGWDAASVYDDITDRLGRSRIVLALVSPAYTRDARCQLELTAAWLAAQHEGEGPDRIIVLSGGDTLDHIYPQALRGSVSSRIPKPKNTKGLGGVVKAVRERLEKISGTMGRVHSLTRPPWHGIGAEPFPRFVGRYPLMWAMHDELAEGPPGGDTVHPPTINLHGLAGIGKSVLAREYALRFGAAYPGGVFWLRAYGAEDPVTGLGAEERIAERDRQIREFAGDLGVIIANRGPAEIRVALGDALGRRQRKCLWIVDDLPAGLGEDGLRDWIGPHALASTIITSRERQPRTLTRPLEVSALPPDDAVSLMLRDVERPTEGELDACGKMAEELGRHALGVNVLSATLTTTGGRPNAAAARAFSASIAQGDGVAARTLVGVVPEGLEAAVTRSVVSALERLSEEGRDFMRVASILAPAPILPTLLSAVWGIVHEIDGEGARKRINQGWVDADALGLTDACGGTGRERSVHPLVSRIVRLVDPAPAHLETLRAAAVNALRIQLPSKYDPSAYAAVEHEISHARELVRRPTTIAEAELLGRVARYDLVRGAYESAAGLFRRQADAYRDIHGDQHPATATATGSLAGVMFLLGDIAQARRLHEQALAARRETLGDENADTLASMNNLATLLGVEGQLTRARELQEEILEIRRRMVGPEHADTMTAMNNLAAIAEAHGDLDAVRTLQQSVLSVQVRRMGPEHPSVTNAAWNLYATLSRLRDDRGAKDVLNHHLAWLLEKEPATLGADQQNIRSLLAEHRQL